MTSVTIFGMTDEMNNGGALAVVGELVRGRESVQPG